MRDTSAPAFRLTRTRLRDGIWEGVLAALEQGAEPPALEVSHHGVHAGAPVLTPRKGAAGIWEVRYRVPLAALSDGVQTFVISEAGTGLKLDAFTIVSGEPLDDDIRAEVALLRAELDMLKRAFRRQSRG